MIRCRTISFHLPIVLGQAYYHMMYFHAIDIYIDVQQTLEVFLTVNALHLEESNENDANTLCQLLQRIIESVQSCSSVRLGKTGDLLIGDQIIPSTLKYPPESKMTPGLINANPVIHETKARSTRHTITDETTVDEFDAEEIFDHVRDITDPEHPYSLEQLNVVSEDSIAVDDKGCHVTVTFTPTVQHCSMATVIGLCIRVKLLRCLPPRFKVDIKVSPGSHASESAVNKQLNDKERVAAALENPHLVEMVEKCLASTE